jgi:hypothetical protein
VWGESYGREERGEREMTSVGQQGVGDLQNNGEKLLKELIAMKWSNAGLLRVRE